MEVLTQTKEKRRTIKKWTILAFLLIGANMVAFPQEKQSAHEKSRIENKMPIFKSAFPLTMPVSQVGGRKTIKNTHYTIQVCTKYVLINDIFLTGKYKIKPIRMGNLYRYVYSEFATVEEARKELPVVRKYYPGAFIREYDGKRLGKAFDLNIDHIE